MPALAPADAEEFSGFGPIPVRNYQPIQLIFLNLPFERARTLQPGAFALSIESAEINEIATNQERIDAVLKFETNRTEFTGRFSPIRRLELSLSIPFISRFGGFLDPFINAVEDVFQTSNPERDLFPDNTFGGFHVQRGGTVLFDGKKQQLELGDVWGSAKYELWHSPGFPLVAVRGAVKAPTGRADGVFGSGKPDFGLDIAVEHQFLSWLVTYANLAVIYPVGPITPARLTLNPMLTEAVAGEARLWRRGSFVLQQEMYMSPFHGNGARLLDGTVVELTAGLNVACPPFLFQLAAVNNISPVVSAADFSILLRMTYQR
ncbi:MAG: uncharacterized protein H6Q33_202 [Deltaproteobacteria bacterium]|jgi:hypothetical protein|nr:uncharacterized protein [Deltaproteobacteria bacterium]